MAGTDRSTLNDVTFRQDVSRFNFFQLVELLNQLEGVDLEQELDFRPEQERLRFRSTASIGFHPSDVLQVGCDEDGRQELEVAFLGLHGSQSPMPGYYLEELAWEYAQGEQKLGVFLDFFHHRLLTLLHRAWRKYRYHVRFQNEGEDGFSRLMFALVGLGNDAVRDSLPVNRAKMLSYAGVLASPSRSPEVVAGLVIHCFDLDDVAVLAWQHRRVPIHEGQQNRLGKANMMLGGDFVIGDKVNDCAGKFLLKVGNLSFSRFLSFLPNGEHFQPLVRFVSFILRDQLAWDLRLGFAEGEAKGLSLGSEQSSRLGWSSFLGQPPADPYVTICVQE
ncbi:type VI secretion system baseplate subunit TssG [Pectobacterium versatile]|uniref:Type VI secretion system baseplate subunit TssG n=1 Tax=Pectobacterium versatile TaxID=2488639 RepID=A0A221T6D3_9GAMM|nr:MULTISPECIES: type VI secretion system baseplate subunit TssG [Pectobacterium]ASN84453.1 Type VI secretion protein ImpH [Pectobacterium versatile]AZK63899.1 type VI secretion system baseplate subunit TssG [Pectobacterium versatile]MBA0160322.1 type VI secretion system baseplate subunit TssG [Pectobacterium versatile]MBA0165334.1 type VI secretion system baseplate subunit TssG [Pectobacterium versatile]MBA0171544.1 type VI secretion system baseplate subunit TssG [Pectobacterium versatile]